MVAGGVSLVVAPAASAETIGASEVEITSSDAQFGRWSMGSAQGLVRKPPYLRIMCNPDLKKMFVGFTTLLLAMGVMGVGPAMAAPGDTPVTLEVSGGSLSITVTVDQSSVSLGAATPGASTASVNLGDVIVTDTRAGVVGWTATVTASDATGVVSGVTYSIPKANITYTAPTGSKAGTSSVATAAAETMAAGIDVKIATGVTGNNTATWNPSVVVAIPTDALSAAYTAIFTHSVI